MCIDDELVLALCTRPESESELVLFGPDVPVKTFTSWFTSPVVRLHVKPLP